MFSPHPTRQSFQDWLLPAAVLVIPISSAVTVLGTNRNLDVDAFNSTVLSSSVVLSLQVLSATLVFGCLLSLLHSTFKARQKKYAGSWTVIFALSAYFFFNYLFGYLFVPVGEFNVNVLYSFALFLAAIRAPASAIPLILRVVKVGILLAISVGLAFIPFAPSMVLQAGYEESWIGLPYRFYGLSPHANGLGPLALLLSLLEYYCPSRSRALSFITHVIAIGALVLSQSKTTWVIASICLGILFIATYTRYSIKLIPSILLILALLCVTWLLSFLFLDASPANLIVMYAGEDTLTLTGRVAIWQIAIDAWAANPILGYGPEIWGKAFRESIGMAFAFHAHNQALQVLSSAGLMGAATFTIYFVTLTFRLFKTNLEARGVGACLFVLFFVRGITEVPFAMNNVLSGDILIHLTALLFATRSASLRYKKSENVNGSLS